jgi:hypothetical protein
MLRFIIRLTALVLGAGTVLVIVGFFDAFLGWDIFSPELESLLYGVFFSCIVLAAAGIALSFVLGVQEITDLLRASQASQPLPPPRPLKRYVGFAVLGILGLTLLVVALDRVDRRVQAQRNLVFQRLATERLQSFAGKLLAELPVGAAQPESNEELDEVIAAINAPDWVGRATVFLPDPNDRERLWEYGLSWDGDAYKAAFDRLFPSRRREYAVQNAFAGDAEAIRSFNDNSHFSLLHPLSGNGSPVAIVWVQANPTESLRE